MQDVEPRFSLAELVEASGITERTVRQFITDGLVPPSLGRGRSRYFTPAHLERLMLVARMREDRLSTDEIRERLRALDALAGPASVTSETWRRIAVHPDLEIQVRDGASESVQTLAVDLAAQARRWFGDEG